MFLDFAFWIANFNRIFTPSGDAGSSYSPTAERGGVERAACLLPPSFLDHWFLISRAKRLAPPSSAQCITV